MEIRGYHSVFTPERRIYRVDRLRLNPSGVPLRSFAYFAAFAALALLVQRLPGIGYAVGWVPWPVAIGFAPLLLAGAATALQVDGRPAHLLIKPAIRLGVDGIRRSTPKSSATGELPNEVLFVCDGQQAGHPLRYRGPGTVTFAGSWRRVSPTRTLRHGPSLAISLEGPPHAPLRQVDVPPRATLEVVPPVDGS